jgi:hypothetical protein
MGQQARDGRGLRQNGPKASGRVRPDDRRPAGAARPSEAGRALGDPAATDLARGFVLQGYDLETDELQIELHLKPIPIARLRAMFDVGGDPGLCNAHPLDAARAEALQDAVSETIDTDRYAFFLQRYG